jgi:hypothetical protein
MEVEVDEEEEDECLERGHMCVPDVVFDIHELTMWCLMRLFFVDCFPPPPPSPYSSTADNCLSADFVSCASVGPRSHSASTLLVQFVYFE